MCLREEYLLEVAVTIKGTFPKSSTKEVKRILHSVLLGIRICQLAEERSTSLKQRRIMDVVSCRVEIFNNNKKNMFENLHSIIRINRFLLSRTFLECL